MLHANAVADNSTTVKGYFLVKGKEITIDLNNHNITGSGKRVIMVDLLRVDNADKKGVLTLTGNGTVENTGTNAGNSYAVYVGGSAELIVGTGATVKSTYGYAVAMLPMGAGRVSTLTVNGGTVTGKYGVSGNGTLTDTSTVITVNSGSIIGTDVAIYQPQPGTVTVNGGTVTGGDAAIAMRRGSATIAGGEVAGLIDVKGDYAATTVEITGGDLSEATVQYAAGNTLTVADTVTIAAPTGYDWVEQDGNKLLAAMASDSAEFAAAIAAGGNVKLFSDVTLAELVAITGDVTLDLGGYTLTSTANDSTDYRNGFAIEVSGANTKLTIQGEGKIVGTAANNLITVNNGASLILKSGAIEATKYAVNVRADSTFTMNGGSITGKNGIYGADDATIIVNDGNVSGTSTAITAMKADTTINGGALNGGSVGINGNGAYGDGSSITITDGTVTGGEVGIYHPQNGTLTISGGTISGASAVHVKSGSLSITGGTLEATGAKLDYVNSLSGGSPTGDALIIENVGGETGFEAISSVSITGGAFVSANAAAVGSYAATNANAEAEVVKEFISGGTYSSDISELCAEDYVCSMNRDGTFGVASEEDDSESDFNNVLAVLVAMMNREYTVTAEAGKGGTITPAGDSKVKFNKDITYMIQPDAGYAIADVLVDGRSVGAVSKYTFDNVQKNHKISVIFKETAWVNPYSDVSESDWFYADVAFVTANNLMIGTVENKLFAPDLTTNRAMIVALLWRMENKPIVNASMQFKDVPQDTWYSEAVRWAAASGIVAGYENGMFRPEDPITREQMAAILHRYAVSKGEDNGVVSPAVSQFNYSAWAASDVAWADANGLMKGIANDMTDMTAAASRAEVAAILHRFCK